MTAMLMCCWTVGQAGGGLGDLTTKPVSTTKPPAYVLNAGKDGLPIAEGKRPSWLVKEDELIIDARWGLLYTTYCCVADCRPRRNSSTIFDFKSQLLTVLVGHESMKWTWYFYAFFQTCILKRGVSLRLSR